MRHKLIIGFNVNPAVKFAVDWGMSLVSPKMRDRVKLFTNVEDAYSLVDRTLLPTEYGGEIPQAEMIRLWKTELKERREKLLANDLMKVDLQMFSEKARQGAVSAIASQETSCSNAAVFGINGSFRKLEVD
ncbi:Hypothetical predicted protein [Cloeon dipterum]|uniref:CRAL-TRIO domain-containing protein n=1 Tax=Cloeon dipterum TaxID=197152 RepID=A0A8S1E5E5_9INSE|nr:Hypothetical predicted protein [Cloeon dipterum]